MEHVTVSKELMVAVLAQMRSSRDAESRDDRAVAELEEALAGQPAGPLLRVSCLGGFQVASTHGAEGATPPLKRGRELIQYLALHPARSASRERLGEIFWPDLNGENVKHRLHIAASGARAFLRTLLDGFDAIRCGSDGYSWHPALRVDCDVLRFENYYRSGSLEAFRSAVALYAGELLEGEESDWLQRERVKYACMYASMLERLAEAALAAGDAESALSYGMDLLTLDRAHEAASRLVMQCFGNLGRRGRALEEYESLRAYLQRQLGVEPTTQTKDQIGAIMGWAPGAPARI